VWKKKEGVAACHYWMIREIINGVLWITSGVVCGAQELGWGVEMSVAYQNNDTPLASGVHEHGKICHATSKWGPWNGTSPKIHAAYQNNDTPLVACESGTPLLSGVLEIYDTTNNFRAGGLMGPHTGGVA
jgi:hypothetical protein